MLQLFHNVVTDLLYRNIITILQKLIQKEFYNLKFSRSYSKAVPTKKKEKRMLETFLEKPNHPSNLFHLTNKIQESIDHSYKKKEKRTLKTFSKKPIYLSLKSTYYFSPFQKIRKSKRSKKPFL